MKQSILTWSIVLILSGCGGGGGGGTSSSSSAPVTGISSAGAITTVNAN